MLELAREAGSDGGAPTVTGTAVGAAGSGEPASQRARPAAFTGPALTPDRPSEAKK